MNPTLSACFAALAQAFLSCASTPSNAADVMPVWQNDTAANTLSFNDTFGHQISIGTYNPSTGAWISTPLAGTSGGIPYFASSTTLASSAALGANQIVLGGGAGAAPSTPVGLGTATTILHGNASGAPVFGPVSSADIATVMASPPPLGSAVPNTAAATVTTFGDNSRSLQSFGAIGATAPVTITIASPGVVTWTGSNFVANQPVVFQTTGALPTGITAGTTYFVASTGLTANTFQICAASGCAGGAINTSGSQSGTQTGQTDDTSQIQTALRSGVPLTCKGSFSISSLVTVTNTDVSLLGFGSANECIIQYTTAQSMIMLTEVGNQLRTNNRVRFEHIKIIPQAAISSVTGATHTAAIDIEYPLGCHGTISPTVQIFDVQVQPSANANFILNGLYINDVVNAKIDHLNFEGERDTFNVNTSAVVFDGTHTPAELTVTDSNADFVGIGVSAVQETSAGWQGLRVHNFDCVYCANAISARGGLDGTSDQLVVDGVEGPVQNYGILATNVLHATLHDNYFFLSDMAITGGTHATFPTCIEVDWTNAAVPSNGQSAIIHDNTCDGAQVTGYTGRYGIGTVGVSTNLTSHLGVNTMTNLDFGVGITANTAGWFVEHQATKGVTTELQDGSSAGANMYAPPLARKDAAAQNTGYVGEVLSLTVLSASAVSQPTSGTAINVGQISLTPGNWMCNGTVWSKPAAGTTTSALFGSVWTASANLGTPGNLYIAESATAAGAAAGESVNFGPAPFSVTTATPLYLVGNAAFATSTMSLYGSAQCVRYM